MVLTQSSDASRSRILEAARTLLLEGGHAAATTRAIAARARVSKGTIYALFGDRAGLFEALVREAAVPPAAALPGDGPLRETLPVFGHSLLRLLLGPWAVAINRAAIAETALGDASLAQALARGGRGALGGRLVGLLAARAAAGEVAVAEPEAALEAFLGLLIGDLQLRVLLGVAEVPDDDALRARAARAAEAFLRLHAPPFPAAHRR